MQAQGVTPKGADNFCHLVSLESGAVRMPGARKKNGPLSWWGGLALSAQAEQSTAEP